MADGLVLEHLTAFRDVREVSITPGPSNSTSSDDPRDHFLSNATERIRTSVAKRLAANYVQQLSRFFHEARLAHSQYNVITGNAYSVELEMLFEVGKPLRSVICGDGARYTSV